MTLRQTPQMLKKSGIQKGDAMNCLALMVRIVHVCVENQSAEKRRDAIGGKEEEPSLIAVTFIFLSFFLFFYVLFFSIFRADTSLFLFDLTF